MKLSDTKIHGKYIGILIGPTVQGASLEDSRAEMHINAGGITLPSIEDEKGGFLSVHYPPAWIFHMEGWGTEKCFSIRQHERSNLAQVIISDVPWYSRLAGRMFKGVWVDMMVMLGEGMPMPLMCFVRESRGEQAVERLHQKLFQSLSSDYYEDETFSDDWLGKIHNPERVIERGSEEEKRKLAESLGHNLWTASPKALAERIQYLERLQNDPNPMVKSAVMDTAIIGGRVVDMVPLVIRQIDELESKDLHDPDWGMLSATTMDAARCLLYEVHNHLQSQLKVKRRYGSFDGRNIHSQTNGLFPASEQKLMEDFFHGRQRTPATQWKFEHYEHLRSAMRRLLAHPSYYDVKEGAKSIEEYSLPADAGQLLQTQRLHS